MKHEARFSLASKGFLAGAVVMLILGAEHPVTASIEQTQSVSVERIHVYDAQPIRTSQNGPLSQSADYSRSDDQQRWVF